MNTKSIALFNRGQRVKVQAIDAIVKPLQGKFGTVIEGHELSDHNGPYTMLHVDLDESVGVGGSIVLKILYMPSTCFQEIEGES